ncbi:QDE-2-interacting protein [Ilyonectria destructans]|nr:QDE-2-interacting protein [Ilyonectria destructans]
MSSAPGPHTGILREENLVLQQIFGYGDQPMHTDPIPRTGLPLPGSSIKDILLVSVDVDTGGGYEVISPDQSFHVGISIFDTRYLTSNSSTDPQKAIASYQFINRDTKPCKQAAKRFLLGATEIQTLTAIAAKISALTQGRDYILVAHGVNEDLKFLNNIDAGIAARACYILDTVKAAQYTLQLHYRYSLEKLLDALSISYDHFRLHAAGNDAFFALKGLLMIAARDISAKPHAWALGNQQMIGTQSSIATILEAVACTPYSLLADKPQQTPVPEKLSKLSIGAKRRLRAERKAIRRANQTLASTSGLDQDVSHSPDGT